MHSSVFTSLSILLPVYNEGEFIGSVLQRVVKVITSLPQRELIVVNDGSRDNSAAIIEKFRRVNRKLEIRIIHHKINKGKGAALQSGFKKATGDILIIQDADLEYHPKYYPALLRPILDGKTEVVYGSRFLNDKLKLWGKNATPLPLHYLYNQFLSFLTSLVLGQKITDMETGYKVMTRRVYKSLKINSNGFEVEPEITAKIVRGGFKILEVPIKTTPRGYEDGKKITWKDGFKALYFLLKYSLAKN